MEPTASGDDETTVAQSRREGGTSAVLEIEWQAILLGLVGSVGPTGTLGHDLENMGIASQSEGNRQCMNETARYCYWQFDPDTHELALSILSSFAVAW